MCYPVKCSRCGKTTWAGCGAHKDMVMKRVPPAQRCTCGCTDEQSAEIPRTTPAAAAGNPVSIKHISTHAELASEVAQAGTKLVVLDFFATWCAPCKVMAPEFERLAQEFAGRAVFLKVNGDDCAECVEESGVSAFPTFQLLKCGKPVAEVVGVNKQKLRQEILANL